MNDNTPFGMTNEEFKTLIDKYIERGSQNTDDFDLEADMFFDALAGFMEGLSEVILEVKGTWHNGHFTLTPKGPLPRDVHIVENRIALPGMTFLASGVISSSMTWRWNFTTSAPDAWASSIICLAFSMLPFPLLHCTEF